MMESSFERYNDEFSSLIQQIESSLRSTSASASASPNDLNHTQNLLTQCDDLIKQMALEARSSHDAATKRSLMDKVREYKGRHQSLRQELERQTLHLGDGINGGNSLQSQKERLLLQQNEDMLSNQNETLERARRTMQETEAVALEITEELGQNRERLSSAHGRIREVSGLTGRARRILVSMNQRAVQQKLIIYGVAVALLVGFLFMVYSLWR
jgi:vesicle transport through interaction with t-SNAREs 1